MILDVLRYNNFSFSERKVVATKERKVSYPL